MTGAAAVATWNLYVGADLTRAIRARTHEEAAAATAEVVRVLRRTDFPARAAAVARVLTAHRPVVVGLQEAALWTTADPAGGADSVEADFVVTLLGALERAGARYEAVAVQPASRFEAPAGPPVGRTVRLVDRVALLARAGADVTAPRSGTFADAYLLATGTGPREIRRAWCSAEVRADGEAFLFVTAHLEAFDAAVRARQAEELVAPGGPAAGDAAVVLAGDLNTGPELPVPGNRAAYEVLTGAGFTDAWASLHPGEPGTTAGFGELLDDPSPAALRHRVDHVLIRGGIRPTACRIVGVRPADRTMSGMWPSDHAGLVATVTTG